MRDLKIMMTALLFAISAWGQTVEIGPEAYQYFGCPESLQISGYWFKTREWAPRNLTPIYPILQPTPIGERNITIADLEAFMADSTETDTLKIPESIRWQYMGSDNYTLPKPKTLTGFLRWLKGKNKVMK